MKKSTVLITIAFAAAFLLVSTKKAFAALVRNQKIRGCDGFGCGNFGASRGNRSHNGIDIEVAKGQSILSPISGEITRFPFPYANDKTLTGIEIINPEFSVKVFYVVPGVRIGTFVRQGQRIAIAQDVAAKYGTGMTNHIHLEVRSTSTGAVLDPQKLF